MRADWDALSAAVALSEKSGFDSIWTSDHLLSNSGRESDPVLDSLTTLGALAATTERARVGTLVAAVSLRHPALLAKAAVTIDHISHGRMILGLGTGWFEREHLGHGLPFGTQRDRSDRLEEALPLIRGLIDGRTVKHRGRSYALDAIRHGPPAYQQHLPILVGGEGRNRTLRSAAAHADLWHARGSLEHLIALRDVVTGHCLDLGRDPTELTALTTRWIVLRDDPAQAEAALERSLARHGASISDRDIVALGPPATVARSILPTISAGFRDILVSLRSPFDLETIRRLPELRAALADIGEP
jgi:alkanesulfonate monooxygenase SsuD/methylene tetrahydromethanopterin reductase-like flavin-dependent oxidoreductase (luciferase family)